MSVRIKKWLLLTGGGALLGALLGYLARCAGST